MTDNWSIMFSSVAYEGCIEIKSSDNIGEIFIPREVILSVLKVAFKVRHSNSASPVTPYASEMVDSFHIRELYDISENKSISVKTQLILHVNSLMDCFAVHLIIVLVNPSC